MGNYTDLSSLFSAIANSIREKSGNTGQISAHNFPDEIANLPGESKFVFGSQSFSDTTSNFTVSGLAFNPKGIIIGTNGKGSSNQIVKYLVYSPMYNISTIVTGESKDNIYSDKIEGDITSNGIGIKMLDLFGYSGSSASFWYGYIYQYAVWG